MHSRHASACPHLPPWRAVLQRIAVTNGRQGNGQGRRMCHPMPIHARATPCTRDRQRVEATCACLRARPSRVGETLNSAVAPMALHCRKPGTHQADAPGVLHICTGIVDLLVSCTLLRDVSLCCTFLVLLLRQRDVCVATLLQAVPVSAFLK